MGVVQKFFQKLFHYSAAVTRITPKNVRPR